MSNLVFASMLLAGVGITGSIQATDTPPIVRGTINVIVANGNGIVALTDSMQTATSAAGQRQLPDPGQKLFRLDDTTVCTIAGFGSAATPTAPEFLNSASAIMYKYSQQARSDQPQTIEAKLKSLEFLFEFYLSGVADLRQEVTGSGNYLFQLLIAGYDPDGTPRIGGVVIDVVPDASGRIFSGIQKQWFVNGVGRDVAVLVAGQREVVADKILSNPTAWVSDQAIARYADSFKSDRGASLSIEDMKSFAVAVAKQTSARSASVGGPNQIAVLSSGRISSIQQPEFTPPQLPPFDFDLVEGNIGPAGAFVFGGSNTVQMYFANTFVGGNLKLDHGFFFGNEVRDCRVTYNGGRTRFDPSNRVTNSTLYIGKEANHASPEVKQLLKNYRWRSVEYEQ